MINYKMSKLIFISTLIIVFLSSCNNQSDEKGQNYKDLSFLNYDESSGKLTIDYSKLKDQKLKEIEVKNNTEINNQSIFLDSNLLVYRISNYKKTDSDEHSESYFYETFLDYKNDTVFIECRFQRPLLNRQYILIGDLDEQYRFNNKIDTVFFNKEGVATFPDAKAKFGKNKIRFIIVDEGKKNGIMKRRTIYAIKTYIYEK